MNIEKLFDFIVAKEEADGSTFNWEFEKDKKIKKYAINEKMSSQILTKSVQAFMHNVGQPLENKKTIQAFQGSSALPQLTKDVFDNTMAVDNQDLLWQNAYKSIKLKKGQLSWEITDTATSIVFREIPEGGKVDFEKLSGAKVVIDVLKYGAGLGVTWETIEGRKLYKFVEQMESARAALYKIWSDTHYGAIATASTSNQVTWQGAGTDRIIDRDILTLNEGTNQCGTANKDKGYGDMANASYILYAQPAMRARINAALKATYTETTRAGLQGEIIDYNIMPFYTYNASILANKAVLVLPGRKIQNSIYLREMGLSKKQIESLNELRTYWTAFGNTVGDTDQVFELSFS